MYFKCRLPGQELGSAPVLLVLYIRTSNAVCNAHGMEGAGKSPHRPLLVLPIQKGITKKKKWTVEYANIPVAIRLMPHGNGVPIPEPTDSPPPPPPQTVMRKR